jgi:hypothetical protein
MSGHKALKASTAVRLSTPRLCFANASSVGAAVQGDGTRFRQPQELIVAQNAKHVVHHLASRSLVATRSGDGFVLRLSSCPRLGVFQKIMRQG